MPQKLVRLSEPAHRQLELLAERLGWSMAATLNRLIAKARRDQFWDDVDKAYERIWADPKATAAEMAERKLLEGTLLDGLKDDPWIEPRRAAKSGLRTSAKRSGMSKRDRVRH